MKNVVSGIFVVLLLGLSACTEIPPQLPDYMSNATMSIGDDLSLLVRGTPFDLLRQAFGEPAGYHEEWSVGSDGAASEPEWHASFIVEGFDRWIISTTGSKEGGLRNADAENYYGASGKAVPAGEPQHAGTEARPLWQLGTLMQPTDVTERLGVPYSTEIRDGKPLGMTFCFKNVWWELVIRYGDVRVANTGNDVIDFEYGVSSWRIQW